MFVASVYSHLRGFHVPYMSLLQEWGYEVIASASDGGNSQAKQELEALGFWCVDIPFDRQPLSMSNALAYKKLRTFLASRQDIELIHVHTPVAAFITRKAAEAARFNGTLLYTAHGFHFYRGSGVESWLIYYMAEKRAAKLTDGLITINSEDYEIAKKFVLSDGGQVYYVPGVGIDLAKYRPGDSEERQKVRAQLDADPKDIVFVYVAEINRNKNQSQFLTAFREAFCEDTIPAKAWIIGEGPLRADMESLACKLGVDRKVSFLGRRNDVPELLRGADVAVLLSHREGLPRCLMEASATELPIVATDVRGNRDIVSNGSNGILVDPDDVKSAASALYKLATEPHTRRAMGKRGREEVSTFSLDNVIRLMEDIYVYWLDEP
jgi:glycosyltransferase involved in cell wall biosynthesis